MLAKWTISGFANPVGYECLRLSIHYWKLLYPECRCVVAYNGVNSQQLEILESLEEVELLDQSTCLDRLPVPAKGPAWKLYPPRLDINDYEIWIDNDLVVYSHSDTVRRAIQSGVPFITEGLYRNMGQYEKFIRPQYRINSGWVGLPPGFDVEGEIRSKLIGPWDSYFDEQGLVGWIITSNNGVIVPIKEVYICDHDFQLGEVGIHFVGLNSKPDRKKFWETYATTRIML